MRKVVAVILDSTIVVGPMLPPLQPEEQMTAAPIQHPPRPEGWEREIYPMPAFPMLVSADLERTSRWYQDPLGFVDVFTFRDGQGKPLLAHLRWAKYADLLISGARAPLPAERGVGVTLVFAEMDVDALAERVRRSGAEVTEGPVNTPWNTR